MADMENPVQTINSSLPLNRSSENVSGGQKGATIAVLLTKLAVHYYRPDFTEGQAKSLIRDMVEDLSMFTLAEVDWTIKEYRRNAEHRFFPTSGQLRAPILAARKEQADMRKTSTKVLPTDPRPIRWWDFPPYLWRPHWQESEVPAEYHATFVARLKIKRAAGVPGWAVSDFAGHYRKWNYK